MTAQILDGKATAAAIKSELGRARRGAQGPGCHARSRHRPGRRRPGQPDRTWPGKHRDCAQVGIASIQRELPADATQEEIEAVVRELNDDPTCTGYIVQLPLPKGIDANRVLELMDPDKDADGLHPMSLGRLVLGQAGPLPCTPNGIVELLRRHDVEINGAEVVVVGRGITVGRSIGLLLTRRSRERHGHPVPHRHPRPVRACCGRPTSSSPPRACPHLVKPEDVKPGAAVLDVGVSRDENGSIVGDVHPGVREVAGWISPNPGGVGPMTRALLLQNVVEAAERQAAAGQGHVG